MSRRVAFAGASVLALLVGGEAAYGQQGGGSQPPPYPPPPQAPPPQAPPPAPPPYQQPQQPYRPPSPQPAYPQPAQGQPPVPQYPPPPQAPPPAPPAASTAPPEEPPPAEPKFYAPTPADALLPWNTHDPWRGPVASLAMTAGVNNFFTGKDISGRLGGEVGARLGVPAVGVVVGSYLANSALIVGLDFLRGYGAVVYDAELPDVQVGILFPDFQLRYIYGKDVSDFNAVISVTGMRVTIEDFLEIDLRVPAFGYWKDVSNTKGKDAWSWGASLDVGIVF